MIRVDKMTFKDLFCCDVGDQVDNYEVVEAGEWVSEGKYEVKEVVFKDTLTDTYYIICDSRTGSHYTDWYYASDDEDTIEADVVKPVETKVIKWERFRDDEADDDF